ncbi:MAG: hypothetical protein HFH60_05450 [Lachnospiraceae bacterium]|nr:hypothetical protein [Lachnospiraceae bacterium]MCI9546117.1 hypothetical protein [Lachnospiraceae bacterium]
MARSEVERHRGIGNLGFADRLGSIWISRMLPFCDCFLSTGEEERRK